MHRAPADPDVLRRELVKIVGDKRLSMSDSDLEAYSRDMWPRLLIAIQGGRPLPHRPHAVVWPESAREVAAIVNLARELDLPVIPYGGGSGVCGGAVPISGGISVDLKRLDRFVGLSRDEMSCDVEAGMGGERFERELSRRGYTLGHFPSSIYCSTVGGWLACRAAGQMSTKYGKIEDRVIGLTMVTGRGEIVETDDLARASRGPNWTQLVVGSEGTLGIITSARLRISLSPAVRIFRGFEFERVEHGLRAIRRVMQRGLRPAVVRLYNELDTLVHSLTASEGDDHADAASDFTAPVPPPGSGALPKIPGAAAAGGGGMFDRLGRFARAASKGSLGSALFNEAIGAALKRPKLTGRIASGITSSVAKSGCRFIVGLEGSRIRTEIEARLTFDELARAGGKDLGEQPGLEWFEHRYAVSYGMSKVFRDGAFVDTMEVASTWDRILDLYRAVHEALSEHAVVMAHFSHAYEDGCSIYFTFAAHTGGHAEAERRYDRLWRDGLSAATRAGATISHHHGVGLLKAPYMVGEHREAMRLLNAVKKSLDPSNIMNPGKLGLPGFFEGRES